MYGKHFQQSMDQPGMVTNPARGQLNRGECVSSRLLFWSRGIGSTVPSRASLLSFSTLRLRPVLTYGISPTFHEGRVHIYCQSPSGQSRDYRLTQMRLLSRVHWHRSSTPSSPQGSFSNGCCLFRFPHGPFLYALYLSPHPLLVCSGHVCNTESMY